MLCNDIKKTNCDYTYRHDSLNHSSYVDYFIVSKCFKGDIIHHSILEDEVNLSDHLPIALSITMDHLTTNCKINALKFHPTESGNDGSTTRLRWDHANLQLYYATTYSVLLPIFEEFNVSLANCLKTPLFLPCHCNNLIYYNGNECVCKFTDLIETTYSNIVTSIDRVAQSIVPTIRTKSMKFWWDQELNELKDKATISHRNWLSANKPNHGELNDLRKKQKYAYKKAIRNKQKDENLSITTSLHDALSAKDHSTFWKMWKSKFGSQNKVPLVVNGHTDSKEIADAFAHSFALACSSNSKLRNDKLYEEFIEKLLKYKEKEDTSLSLITVEIVDNIISKLKNGKAASLDNLTAEHIKYSHPIIVKLLSELFNLMLKTNYVPNSFGLGVIIPIPKSDSNKGNCTTDDFRGITISPVISKIFEHCLLLKYDNYLYSEGSQFGFKKNCSTSHAIYAVRKTIEHFVDNDSTVTLCSLDMSKAFDKVNKYALFIKLMHRKCPLNFIKILHCWYDKTFACVRWGKVLSPAVRMTAGVRQGGVLSPFLFSVYVNDMLINLRQSRLGCHIRTHCFNAFMYADDLLMLSISFSDMQNMVDICQQELDWLDMSINIKKCAYLRVGKRFKQKCADILINGKSIVNCQEIKYLGIYISSGSVFRCNVHNAKIHFFRALNSILGKIGTNTSINLTLSLVTSYANPVLLYGLETGLLCKSQIDKLEYPFNSIFMKLFSSFDKEIISQCQFYSGVMSIKHTLHLRFLTFCKSLMSNTNNSLSSKYLFALSGTAEYNEICNIYGINKYDSVNLYKKKIWRNIENNFIA